MKTMHVRLDLSPKARGKHLQVRQEIRIPNPHLMFSVVLPEVVDAVVPVVSGEDVNLIGEGPVLLIN